MGEIKILLADDHAVVLEGLGALLQAEPEFTVIGKVNDSLAAIVLVEKLQPNVLLIDVAMPNLNGLEVTRQVKKRFPKLQVIMLSMHANEAYVVEALRSGASGYVLKESSLAEVITAIRQVSAGKRYLSQSISQESIDSYLQKAKTTESTPYDTLTARERQILQMTAESLSGAEIGRRLFISPRTVEIHRQNAMRKLGLRNQTDLVRFAIKQGILPTA